MPDLMELSVADPIVLPPKRPRSALPGGGRPRSSLSWSDEANFRLGWGLVGPTGGSDIGEGREPLLPSAVGPRGRKRLAYMPRVSKAGCHPFIILDY